MENIYQRRRKIFFEFESRRVLIGKELLQEIETSQPRDLIP